MLEWDYDEESGEYHAYTPIVHFYITTVVDNDGHVWYECKGIETESATLCYQYTSDILEDVQRNASEWQYPYA
jgi:hypothetical protein